MFFSFNFDRYNVMEAAYNFVDSCPSAVSGPAASLFLALVQALVNSRCNFKDEYPSDRGSQLVDGDEFDFIVVGGGSAGSIVASRLSEEPNWKVLLLEAGTYPSMTSKIPMLFTQIRGTHEDWNYDTEPSSTCCQGFDNQRCIYARGKVLGGSSSINAMLYEPSTKQDHDGWVKSGNINWDHESVLKHYRIIENELNLTTIAQKTKIQKTLINAYQELGFSQYTDENLIGYGYKRFTIGKDGTRTNSAKAFLSGIKHRKNLVVAFNAHVTKVNIDKNKQTTGVEVLINNRLVRLKSKKEVVLSAGSINTPQILMRSGVGPKEHLISLRIPVKSNLRVGENLQDHVIFLGLVFNVNTEEMLPTSEKELLDDVYNYFMHRTGPLVQQELLGFKFFGSTTNSSQEPNLIIYHVPHHQNNPVATEAIYNNLILPRESVQFYIENNKKSSAITIFPKVLTPKSRGKILLRSTDPHANPIIHPNFFSDPDDVELMMDAIKFIKKISKTKTFSKLKPKLVELPVGNCKEFEFDTDDFWKCAIKNLGHHIHHPVGTCKMGPKSDQEAVVDHNLKVYGVDGLRVVDASIIPVIPKAGTNAPTMMIGNKGAEIIKEEWLNVKTN
ncbi:hypothetical protein FQR65_LT05009 [Abscondita terminalis]|nr:hypothetical protein FQR65_LT05009 [Abscondita terminalis]